MKANGKSLMPAHTAEMACQIFIHIIIDLISLKSTASAVLFFCPNSSPIFRTYVRKNSFNFPKTVYIKIRKIFKLGLQNANQCPNK